MARYGFTSPGADASDAIMAFLLQREQLNRQAMLDEMAREAQTSAQSARTRGLDLQAQQVKNAEAQQAVENARATTEQTDRRAGALTSTLGIGQELTPEQSALIEGSVYAPTAGVRETLPSRNPMLGTSDPGGQRYGVYQGTPEQQVAQGQRSARQQLSDPNLTWAQKQALLLQSGANPSSLLAEEDPAAVRASEQAFDLERQRRQNEANARMAQIQQSGARGRGSAGGTGSTNTYLDAGADRTIDMIDAMIPRVSSGNTGMAAQLLGGLGGTPQHDFREDLDAIKANIGFKELSEMRQASQTGGALGQVSDFENRLLQAVLGNLSASQSADQLRVNLGKVRERLQAWEEAKQNPEMYLRQRGVAGGQAPLQPVSSRESSAPTGGFVVRSSRPK